jgi:DNA-binding MarR family transcriptional regulator
MGIMGITEATTTAADPAPSTAPDLGYLVEQTAGFAEGFMRWIGANVTDGLSYPRVRLLKELHGRGPAIMRELADQIGLTARNMTVAVDTLEAEGLVRRRPHPTDRRALLVELTAAGEQAADALVQPRVRSIGELFDELAPERQAQFLEAVVALLAGLRRRGIRTQPCPGTPGPDHTRP